MYYNDGLKIKEIAQILNISEGTVKSRIHNGLKKLNTKVDEMQKRGLYTFRMLPLGFLYGSYPETIAVQKKITEHYTMPELWLGKTFYRMRQWLLEIKLPELKWLEEIKML